MDYNPKPWVIFAWCVVYVLILCSPLLTLLWLSAPRVIEMFVAELGIAANVFSSVLVPFFFEPYKTKAPKAPRELVLAVSHVVIFLLSCCGVVIWSFKLLFDHGSGPYVGAISMVFVISSLGAIIAAMAARERVIRLERYTTPNQRYIPWMWPATINCPLTYLRASLSLVLVLMPTVAGLI